MLLRTLFNPQKALQSLWRRFPLGSLELRLQYDIFARPHYAYCVYQAAALAKRLGCPRVSVLEFGVAGGNGLLYLEEISKDVERQLDVSIDIYGFDTGAGLPNPIDYRDLPYLWKQGFFAMDLDRLKSRLTRAKLVLGDVKETVPTFLERLTSAPIGACFFDLDFYSSTAHALRVFAGSHDTHLPRAFCYFDDIISSDVGILSEDVGQLLAIKEFNRDNPVGKITPIHGFRHTRAIPSRWNDQIYVFHDFEHPLYNQYIHEDSNRQLPI